MRLPRLYVLFFSILLMCVPAITQARYFNPNDVLTDKELLDKDALSRASIQLFLEKKGSVLARYTQLWNGSLKRASDIIWLIGQEYGINPKFLLAKLQHEQGLLDKTTATDKALGWATGYSCYAGGCNDKYKGFAQQLDATASTQLIYTQNPSRFKFKVGVSSVTTDGATVTPENQATANLYIYTPYQGGESKIGGIYFFSRLWDKYFTTRYYPDGLTLKDEQGAYYVIDKGKKRVFDTESTYLAKYTPQDYFTSVSTSLTTYPSGPPVTTESLLTEARFTKFTTASTDPTSISDVSKITLKDGTVFKNSMGDTFILSNGERHRLINLTTASRVFGQDKITNAPVWGDTQIALTTAGDPIDYIDDSFKDGDEAQKAYLAVYESANVPSSWKIGESQQGNISFRNVGALNWKPDEVWLKIKSTGEKIPLTKEITSGGTAQFSVSFPSSKTPALVDEFFILENKEGPLPGALIIKTYSIHAQEQASFVSDPFPESVSNLKKPVRITLKVKNTGTTSWNPRRTALVFNNTKNKKLRSVFYDASDWIRSDVAATPTERKTIKPGDSATFVFTLDARGIQPGLYTQDVSIKLTNSNKVVWLEYAKPYTLDITVIGKSYKKVLHKKSVIKKTIKK